MLRLNYTTGRWATCTQSTIALKVKHSPVVATSTKFILKAIRFFTPAPDTVHVRFLCDWPLTSWKDAKQAARIERLHIWPAGGAVSACSRSLNQQRCFETCRAQSRPHQDENGKQTSKQQIPSNHAFHSKYNYKIIHWLFVWHHCGLCTGRGWKCTKCLQQPIRDSAVRELITYKLNTLFDWWL